jgi:TolA-binding protein
MKRILPIRAAAFAALASVALTGGALAQQDQRSPPNFLDNLFNRGESNSQQAQAPREAGPPDASDLIVRIDRLENALRQVTGTIEQLQYQNQQLQLQVQRLQGGAAAPNAAPAVTPGATPAVPPPSRPGSRSDVFDPSQRPTAPGAPRQLGNMAAPGPTAGNEPPIGAPGGRDAGAPLDLSTPRSRPFNRRRATPPARNWRRCRRPLRRRTNTTWLTAMCCTKTMRWPSRPSAIS